MKRFLITTVALLLIVITNASNTTTITTATNASNMEHSVAAPAYWSGWVGWATNTLRLYIDVYRVPNQCDAFYAVATKYEDSNDKVTNINKELVVKSGSRKGSYYVTYEGRDYYFYM